MKMQVLLLIVFPSVGVLLMVVGVWFVATGGFVRTFVGVGYIVFAICFAFMTLRRLPRE